MVASSRIRLRDVNLSGRHELLAEATGLDEVILDKLRPEHGLSLQQADHMIENAVGILGIPIGIACNFTINGRDVLSIPWSRPLPTQCLISPAVGLSSGF